METKQEILQMNREREIDLIALMWEIIYHWRALAVCAIACAVGLAGYKYFSDARSYKSAQEQEVSAVTAENAALTAEERQAVEDAIALKKQIVQRENYLSESTYLNLDAYEVDTVSTTYYVMLDDIGNYDGETLRYVGNSYVDAYLSYLSNGTIGRRLRGLAEKKQDLSELTDSSRRDLDVMNLTELIRSSKSSESAQFTVRVYGKDKQQAEKLADQTAELLMEYQAAVEEKVGKHTLVTLDRCSYVYYDSELARIQNEQTEVLKSMRANLQTVTAAFTQPQKDLFNGTVKEEMNVEEETLIKAVPPALSIKYLALGFMAGGFLVCMWIAGVYILSAKIHQAEELQNIYGLRIFGLIQTGEKKKRFLGAVDNWLDSLRRKEKWTMQEQRSVTIANLLMACKKEAVKSVMFTSAHHLETSDKQAVESMMEALQKHGVQAAYGENMIRNVTTFEEMAEIGQVVFLEKENVSNYHVLEKELLLCVENRANVLGIVGLQ